MGLKETKVFHSHIKLESIGETREAYVSGDLYGVDDKVVIKETEEVGTVKYCASNYLVVELHTGQQVRKWLDAVELVEKATKAEEYKYEWGKDDGTKWMKKLTPGQSEEKHTSFKSFKESEAQALAKMKIDREKDRDAKKHDRMLDRARTTDTKRANKGLS
jgi:hypothetical protein